MLMLGKCRCPKCRKQFDGPIETSNPPWIARKKYGPQTPSLYRVECLACTMKRAGDEMGRRYAAMYEQAMWKLSGWLSVEGGTVEGSSDAMGRSLA